MRIALCVRIRDRNSLFFKRFRNSLFNFYRNYRFILIHIIFENNKKNIHIVDEISTNFSCICRKKSSGRISAEKPITFNSYIPHIPNTHVSSAIKFRDNAPYYMKNIFSSLSYMCSLYISKNMFHSHLIETTFYVNASLKLYCLAIIFIGFCI